jgi:hypothetical protein
MTVSITIAILIIMPSFHFTLQGRMHNHALDGAERTTARQVVSATLSVRTSLIAAGMEASRVKRENVYSL